MFAFSLQTADITAKSGQFSSVAEVLNVLARVKTLSADNHDKLEAVATCSGVAVYLVKKKGKKEK